MAWTFTISATRVVCPFGPSDVVELTVIGVSDQPGGETEARFHLPLIVEQWWENNGVNSNVGLTYSPISSGVGNFFYTPMTCSTEWEVRGFSSETFTGFSFLLEIQAEGVFPDGCASPAIPLPLTATDCGTVLTTTTAALELLPVAVNDTAVADFETPISIDVLANDTLGGNPATPGALAGPPTVTSPPAHGTVSWNGSTFDYTPDAGYCGHDTFTYEIQT